MANLTAEQKEELSSKLVDKWVDQMDLGDLVDFFREGRWEFLDSLSDDALLDLFKDNDLDITTLVS